MFVFGLAGIMIRIGNPWRNLNLWFAVMTHCKENSIKL